MSARYRSLDTAGQLLDLAEQLSKLLVPVQIDTNGRRRIEGELLLATQRSPLAAADRPRRQRRGKLIRAAALGSVASVIGVIIAFVLRYRSGRTGDVVV